MYTVNASHAADIKEINNVNENLEIANLDEINSNNEQGLYSITSMANQILDKIDYQTQALQYAANNSTKITSTKSALAIQDAASSFALNSILLSKVVSLVDKTVDILVHIQ